MPVNPPPINVKIKGQDRISRTLNTVGAKLKKFGGGVSQAGRTMSMRMTLPLVLMGGAAIKAAANFESSMLNVQALTNTTGDTFNQLREQAKTLGATTMFSASQAGEAMGFLAMAGFDANEILAATPGALKLAAAGNLELAEAADIASNVLTGFNLEATEMDRVNRALAHTAASSNTNIQQLGEAMKFAAPVAAGLGVSVEETAAAVGFLSNAGIQASMAGTSLRKAMISLASPTSEAVSILNRLGIRRSDILDAEGRLKSFTGAIEVLEKRGATVQDTLKIMGIRAGPGMVSLMAQGSKSLREFNKEIGEQGAASLARLAAARTQGFNGAMLMLKSALESVAIAIADSGVLEFLTGLITRAAGAFRELSKTNPEILKIGFAVAAAAAALGPLLVVMGGLIQGLGVLTFALKAFIIPFKIFNLLFAISPVGALVLAVGLLITGIVLLIKKWDVIISKFKSGFAVIRKVGGFFKSIFGGGEEGEAPTAGRPTAGAGGIARTVEESRRTTTTTNEARVKMEFKNVPPGARVTTENEGVDLEQDLGFAQTG